MAILTATRLKWRCANMKPNPRADNAALKKLTPFLPSIRAAIEPRALLESQHADRQRRRLEAARKP
jgi:hypothetical protein